MPDIADHPENVLRIQRRFDAPRPFVFALWTRPALLAPWWGPEGFRLAACEIDFRPGGRWRFNMEKPGESHWTGGVYHEIEPEERIVFSYDFDDFGIHSVCSVRLEPEGNATRMRFCQTGFPAASELDSHAWGWGSTFTILEDVLLRLHGIGSIFPSLPEARRDGVARDLEAARQRWEDERERDRAADAHT